MPPIVLNPSDNEEPSPAASSNTAVKPISALCKAKTLARASPDDFGLSSSLFPLTAAGEAAGEGA